MNADGAVATGSAAMSYPAGIADRLVTALAHAEAALPNMEVLLASQAARLGVDYTMYDMADVNGDPILLARYVTIAEGYVALAALNGAG